jgi:imidazoleglycerol phosphate dehydratase HisB
MTDRLAVVRRETTETNISLELVLDGSGVWETNTGVRIFDHLIAQIARHGLFDIKLSAVGNDQHHLVEDVAICLGRAFNEALGERRGIVRMADVAVPMDDALAMVAVDIGGRTLSATLWSRLPLKAVSISMPGSLMVPMTIIKPRPCLRLWVGHWTQRPR